MKQMMSRDTARVEAFSDGVIAVAITLLVLDIHVPEVKNGLSIGQALLIQWPSYLGYVTSFLVIGIFWANHHNMFCHIKCTDHVLLLVNTSFLMCIAFIPFATSLLTRYVTVAGEEHTVAVIYSATLLLNGILFDAIWCYVVFKRHLLKDTVTPELTRLLTRNYLIGLPIYLVSLILSLVNVQASLILYLVVSLIYSMPISLWHFDLCHQQEKTSTQDDISL